jgi:hypothetical protein
VEQVGEDDDEDDEGDGDGNESSTKIIGGGIVLFLVQIEASVTSFIAWSSARRSNERQSV